MNRLLLATYNIMNIMHESHRYNVEENKLDRLGNETAGFHFYKDKTNLW